MNESTTKVTRHFTGCASLAAVGVKLKQLDLFGPIRKSVQIAQKTVKDTPIDKLYDAFISPAFWCSRAGRNQQSPASRSSLADGLWTQQVC